MWQCMLKCWLLAHAAKKYRNSYSLSSLLIDKTGFLKKAIWGLNKPWYKLTFLKNMIQLLISWWIWSHEYFTEGNDPVNVFLKEVSEGYAKEFYRILALVGVYPSVQSTLMKMNLYVNCNNHHIIIGIAGHGLRCMCGCMQVTKVHRYTVY